MSAMCYCASCACQLLQACRCRCREFVELMAMTASTTRIAIACCNKNVCCSRSRLCFGSRYSRSALHDAVVHTMDGMRSWGHPELPRSRSDTERYDAELRNQHRRQPACHVGLSGNGLRRRGAVAPVAIQGAARTCTFGVSSQAPAFMGPVSAGELGCACFTLQSA